MLLQLGNVNGALAGCRDEDRTFFRWGDFDQVADGDLRAEKLKS
jgi:hypothetical protein